MKVEVGQEWASIGTNAGNCSYNDFTWAVVTDTVPCSRAKDPYINCPCTGISKVRIIGWGQNPGKREHINNYFSTSLIVDYEGNIDGWKFVGIPEACTECQKFCFQRCQ